MQTPTATQKTVIPTADFLNIVLPAGIHYLGFTSDKVNRAGRKIINCTVFRDGDTAISKARHKTGADLYFAMASFKQAKIYDPEKAYEKSYRHQDNVDRLKSVWLDVDFKSYDSPADAIGAIKQFTAHLPGPTFTVFTGGGVHLYWTFDRELTKDEWQPLANGLAGLAQAKGLKADFGVTIDSARVLRLPGSENQKYDNKPTCRVLSAGDIVTVEEMEPLLSPFSSGSTTKKKSKPDFEVNHDVVVQFNPAGNTDLTAGYDANIKSSMVYIAKECGVVTESLRTQGADDPYPLWKDLLHLAAFTTDGGDFVARLSQGYDGYDAAEAEMRYDESVATRVAGRAGPTTCARFSTMSPACAVCKHRGTIVSPWSLGMAPPSPDEVEDPSFVLNGSTYRYVYVVSDDDGPTMKERRLVVPVSLAEWMLVPVMEDDGDDDFELQVMLRSGTMEKTMVLRPSLFANPMSLKKVLFGKYLTWSEPQVKAFTEVAMSWISLLRARADGSTHSATMGWNEDRTSFTVGSREYTPDGVNKVAISSALESDYSEVGELGPWTEVAQRLCDDPSPQFSFLLAAGMASPIMNMGSPLSIAVSAYSRESGAGKSTVLKVIQSAFGKPEKMMTLDDTANFAIKRMGLSQGMPAIWDEIRGRRAGQDVTDVLFRLSQGKTKGRMNSQAELQKTYTLNSMLMIGTNIRLSDYVNEEVKQTNAGAMRFIEVEMDKREVFDPTMQDMIAKLSHNYGLAGSKYATFLVNNVASLEPLLKKVSEAVDKRIEFKNQERFWRDAICKIVTTAMLLRQSGLLDIDVSRVMDFSVECIAAQRHVMASTIELNDAHLLHNIVQYLANERLFTTGLPGHGSRPVLLATPMSNIVSVQIIRDADLVWVSRAGIEKYATAHHLMMGVVTDELIEFHHGAMGRRSMGGGTSYSAGKIAVMEFPANDFVSDAFLGEDTSSSSGTASSSASPPPPMPDSSTGAPP